MKCTNLNELGLQLNKENWKTVYDANEVDDKVSAFTSTIARMLDEQLPKRTVRTHPSDKLWMTSRTIKLEIKARQKAYTSGDKARYEVLCEKVASLISKTKENYYQLKAEGMRETNTAKWYKTIYEIAPANDCGSQTSAVATAVLADRLQQSFIKSWQNASPT